MSDPNNYVLYEQQEKQQQLDESNGNGNGNGNGHGGGLGSAADFSPFSFAVTSDTQAGSINKPPTGANAISHDEFISLWYKKVQFTADFSRKSIYKDSLRFVMLLFFRVLLVSAATCLLLVAYSQIPFSKFASVHKNLVTSNDYYNMYPVAVAYSVGTFLTYAVIGYGFWVFMYGFHRTKKLLLVIIPALLWASSNFFIFVSAGIDPWWNGMEFVSYFIFGVVVVLSAYIMQKKTGQVKPSLMAAFCVPILVHMLILAIYSYIILPGYRSLNTNTDFDTLLKSAIRVLVHPLLGLINNIVTSAFVTDFYDTSPVFASGIMLGIAVENAIFGRLMLLNIGEIGPTIGVTIGLSFLEIALRTIVRRRLSFVEWFLTTKCIKCPCCTLGEGIHNNNSKSDDNSNSNSNGNSNNGEENGCCCNITLEKNEYYRTTIFFCMNSNYEMLVDSSAIFVVPVMTVALFPHRHVFNLAYSQGEPNIQSLVILSVVQLIVQLITDYVVVVIYRSQKLPIFETFSEEPFRTTLWEIFNYLQMIALILPLAATLPFRGFCKGYEDVCTCRNLDKMLFTPLCDNATDASLFSG